jgi:hypothetical protein
MNLYEVEIASEMAAWQRDIQKPEGVLGKAANRAQKRARGMLPKKAREAIASGVKVFLGTVLSAPFPGEVREAPAGLSLAEREYLVLKRYSAYRRAAVAEGAGTGAGGIFLGLADLPMLLALKARFLFDSARLYGFDAESPSERAFMLTVFQLSFSSKECRLARYNEIRAWKGGQEPKTDWRTLEEEYRDYLDTAKLFQLLPIVGSAVGAAANHSLMKRLLENAMNSYRLRLQGERASETP